MEPSIRCTLSVSLLHTARRPYFRTQFKQKLSYPQGSRFIGRRFEQHMEWYLESFTKFSAPDSLANFSVVCTVSISLLHILHALLNSNTIANCNGWTYWLQRWLCWHGWRVKIRWIVHICDNIVDDHCLSVLQTRQWPCGVRCFQTTQTQWPWGLRR